MTASQLELAPGEPLAPRSLAAVAAALATCAHPEGSHIRVPGDHTSATWCANCGGLRAEDGPGASWQSPALTSRLTKKHFEDVVLLLHAVVQLAQLARAQACPGAPGSPAHIFLRNVRASLSELSRLPVVRDVDRLEEALRAMPQSPVRP
jgi:hypothetical protein